MRKQYSIDIYCRDDEYGVWNFSRVYKDKEVAFFITDVVCNIQVYLYRLSKLGVITLAEAKDIQKSLNSIEYISKDTLSILKSINKRLDFYKNKVMTGEYLKINF